MSYQISGVFHPYLPEEVASAQSEMDRTRSEILRELDIQHESLSEIYALAPLFCRGARDGRIISGRTVMQPEDLRVFGILTKQPCFCYYGSGNHFSAALGWARTKQVRVLFHQGRGDASKLTTAIEEFLLFCSNLEYCHRDGNWECSPLRSIPPQNPGLHLLVRLIEEHWADHSAFSG